MSQPVSDFRCFPIERRPYDSAAIEPVVHALIGKTSLGIILEHDLNTATDELARRHYHVADTVQSLLGAQTADQNFQAFNDVRRAQMDGRLHYDASRALGVNVHTTLVGMCRVIMARATSKEPYFRSSNPTDTVHQYTDTKRARELLQQEFIDPGIMEPDLHIAELSAGDTLIFFASSGADQPNIGAWHDFRSMTTDRRSMVTGVYACAQD